MSVRHPDVERMKKGEGRLRLPSPVIQFWNWLIFNAGWEKILLAVLIAAIPFLLFVNLEINPRTWHDEGDALSIARTLVEDGYYGVKVSDGYQTFGAVQSVGPAVILLAALAFKLFGISLLTGRIVAAVLAGLTLVMFFWTARTLIGQRAAIFGIIILISVPGLRFLYIARQFLGIVPALGFFLSGFLLWYTAVRNKKTILALPAGFLIGCAILSKSQYLVLGLGAFGLIALLDLFYYRLGGFKITLIVIAAAAACYGAWNLWQWFYFGPEVYAENGEKLVQLGKVAYGLRPGQIIMGLKFIGGDDTDHFFIFWGFLALLYIGFTSLKKDIQSMGFALLLIFTGLNLAFVIFWTFPWIWHFFAPLAITVLLIAKLGNDLFTAVTRSGFQIRTVIVGLIKERKPLPLEAMMLLGTLVALATFTLWLVPNLENVITYNVRDRVGEWSEHWPKHFALPYETADFLKQVAPPGSIIETSERELAILTDFDIHTPDQSILAEVIPYVYLGTGERDYQLGAAYFDSVQPAYLVIGYFSTDHQVYDADYVSKNFTLLKVFGDGEFDYQVYQRK